MYLSLIIAVAIAAVDQLSKYLIAGNLGITDHITLIPGLIDIVYVENKGAAFSILNEHTWFLSLISAVFCIAILVFILKRRPEKGLLLYSSVMLFGGALGNGIDRIFRGYVVDFIEFTLFKFPVFNIADIAITVGAALLMLYVIISEKDNKNGKDNPDSQ